MHGRMRRHLTFANVMSVIALFCALGGGAYAAVTLPKNSVGSKQIKKAAVTNAKLAKNAVTGAKVKDGSLTASDINISTLPKVGSATNADNAAHAGSADSATHAASADSATHATSADSATNADHATNADNIAAPEAWHVVGSAGEPAFASGASAYSSGSPVLDFGPVSFMKDKEGFVHLKGIVTAGTSGALFTLPPGYRPASGRAVVLTTFCNNCTATVTGGGGGTYSKTAVPMIVYGSNIGATADGVVLAAANAGSVIGLDGLTFRAES